MKSTIVAPRRAVRRRPRPFAEGLLDDFASPPPPAPGPMPKVLAVALASRYGPSPAAPALAPVVDDGDRESDPSDWPAWTDADRWAPSEPAEISPIGETAEPDGIPAAVTRIALVRGHERHEYLRAGDGERWLRVADGSPIWSSSADRAYLEGRVAILPDARPVVPAEAARRPAAAPTHVPTVFDRVWYLGFTLARQGVDAKAPAGWRPDVRAAFDDGLEAGELERLADHERNMADAVEADRMAWDDEAEAVEPHELAEAGLFPPPPFALD